MNKTKALEKLKQLNWEELDWLERQCAQLKPKSKGVRFYRADSSGPASRGAAQALGQHFEDVFHKHHGGFGY